MSDPQAVENTTEQRPGIDQPRVDQESHALDPGAPVTPGSPEPATPASPPPTPSASATTEADPVPAASEAVAPSTAPDDDAAPAGAAQADIGPSDAAPTDPAPTEPAPTEPAPSEPAPSETGTAGAGPAAGGPGHAVPTPGPPRPGPPRPAPPRPGRPASSTGPAHPAAAAVAAPAAQPSPVTAASIDPSRWGRVDDDGTIYVRTADGERVVGSWQAGAPAEGLAHFARRFDDMLTEVELLFARLLAGGGEPKVALSSARTLRDGLDEATVVGDLAGLRSRLDDLVTRAEQALGAARSARDAQRAAAVARKEELAGEAEALAGEATQWKHAGDRYTAILDEWRTIRGIDRKTDELLWKRFSKAREAFNRRRGSHFADLDRQRSSAKSRKEELAVEAEKLADSEDWGPTAARFRDLMTEWKAAGRAHKDADDALWQRFRGAQDAFFARRAGTFAERDAEFVANAEAKKALLTDAERIDLSDPAGARAALRAVQERWEAIGKVPRDDIRALEARLRAVEEKVREAADRQWRRTDPEAEARVAQFRERVAQFEAQAEKARAAGKTKRAEESEAQAAQWREWAETAEQAVQHR